MRRRTPGGFHGRAEPWFGARSKCPANERKPNECTPQDIVYTSGSRIEGRTDDRARARPSSGPPAGRPRWSPSSRGGFCTHTHPVVSDTSAVTVTVSPPAISSLTLPSSSVNVCVTLSLFVMVTSVGRDTVIVFGSNPEAVDSTVIVVPPPVELVVPVAGVVASPASSLLQAASKIATAKARQECCGAEPP